MSRQPRDVYSLRTLAVVPELVPCGIQLFNSRQFFACHEVWEEVWTPQRGPRRLFLQSLIHFAVGLYHMERGNPVGGARQLRKGLRKLAAYLPSCEGIDTARLHADCLAAVERIEAGAPFEVPRIHWSPGSPRAEPAPRSPLPETD
jgi:predicted metal-dependent hydrolase